MSYYLGNGATGYFGKDTIQLGGKSVLQAQFGVGTAVNSSGKLDDDFFTSHN